MANNKKIYFVYGGSKGGNLCLEEKLSVLKEKSNYLLNKRSEIVSASHHKNRLQVNHLTKNGMHALECPHVQSFTFLFELKNRSRVSQKLFTT